MVGIRRTRRSFYVLHTIIDRRLPRVTAAEREKESNDAKAPRRSTARPTKRLSKLKIIASLILVQCSPRQSDTRYIYHHFGVIYACM